LCDQVIDPGNVESSYAFADAKRKLRLVLSTADVQSLHVRNSAAAAAATAASDAEHELIVFLRLQLAEAINLQVSFSSRLCLFELSEKC